MRKELVAHTPNAQGRWHLLDEHLNRVAELTGEFVGKFGPRELGWWCGILHDIGKACPQFQDYLRKAHAAAQAERARLRGPDHKRLSAFVASELLGCIGSTVSFSILGHHGGLPSRADWQAQKKVPVPQQIREMAQSLLSECPGDQSGVERALGRLCTSDLEHELFLRLLFSALVDGDYLDTESHFSPDSAGVRGTEVNLESMLEVLRSDQEDLIARSPKTPVNAIRREVYEYCLRAAELPQGVFKLTVPTGGGKTRSSLAFALSHAVKHGLERVIYTIPYTSIIEQTADVFRSIFKNPSCVLEHHSLAAEFEETEEASWAKLASENWDAPLIVTTTVQLFESLFGNTPSKCRKVHRIARSVIVLDEVQCLPVGLLSPILDALRVLVEKYGVTLVLSTATQPALDAESPYLKGFATTTEILPEPQRYFRELRRVDYQVEPEPLSWTQVAERMRQHDQCLTVVNSRKDALALLDSLGDSDAFHLSTFLCGLHRREVLEKIRERLASGSPCRVVSTQVVEAGVDLDFPVVLRAVGPLDRIIQAAGRCNREGRLTEGTVIIFEPAEGTAPSGPYRSGIEETRQLLRQRIDLHSPDSAVLYFRRLYQDVNTDAHKIQELRRSFNFPETACKAKVIKEDTVPALVAYPGRDGLFSDVLGAVRRGTMTRALWRAARGITVNVYRRDLEQYRDLVEELLPSQLYLWHGEYDRVRGIGAFTRDPGDLVV
ncbi:MAG: CRISPR-associated helicase Cas3' [Armatimonadota bacterium]